jgi:hypothetical protein
MEDIRTVNQRKMDAFLRLRPNVKSERASLG